MRPSLFVGGASLVALGLGGACVASNHPLAPSGAVAFQLDQQPIFAADLLDEAGTPIGPRQAPFEKLVTLHMTQAGAPDHGGYVDVELSPPEVLELVPAGDTCERQEGIFRCTAADDGFARFTVRSISDWSGNAELTLVGRNESATVEVHPAGLPDDATNFSLIIEGGDNSSIRARYNSLSCSLAPMPDTPFPKWPEGAIRVREAEIRVTPPAGSPGVVEHAPVIVQSFSPEAFVTLDATCAEPRTSRLRVQLDALGRSPKFYFCFSDVGGSNISLGFTSGVKQGDPRIVQVEPEPRLLRVVTLDDTVDTLGGFVPVVELSAFDAELNKLPLTVDLRSSDTSVLALSEATAVLPGVGEDARVIAVAPVAAGTATIAVTPELYDQPECISAPITVVEP
ncbi:MAG: hypothetical protein KC731_26810 [Myxococcales bacterium]|nr:hypothetical protein [Myxococcales bacterium]